MKKKITVVIAVVALLVVGVYWAKTKVAVKASQIPAQMVATAQVRRGPFELVVSGTASVTASERITLSAAAGGVVDSVLFDEGARVLQNDVVLKLTNEAYEQALARARLDLLSQQHLLVTMSTSNEADRAQASARLLAAEASLTNRQRELEKLEFSAPRAGRLSAVYANPGDTLVSGQLLATLVDDSTVYAEVMVAQADLEKVKAGQKASVSFGTELPSASGFVDSVGVRAQQSALDRSASVPVLIELENPLALYRAGLAVNATIEVSDTSTVSASGVLSPGSEHEIRAEVSGTLKTLLVRRNDSVRRGQLLYTIENDDLRVLLEQARSELLAARLNNDRVQSGLAPGVSEDDLIQQNYRVQQAELALRARETDLEDLRPKAPFDGTLVALHAKEGESVLPGAPLFSIADYARLSITLPVDELDVARLRPGQQASIKVDAAGGRYSGVVTKIATEGVVKDGIATYPVQITLDEAGDLRSGMSGTAQILVERKEDVLLVPSEAVWFEGERITVSVLKDGKFERVDVSIGLMDADFAEVLAGLQEGDTVVLSSEQEFGIFGR